MKIVEAMTQDLRDAGTIEKLTYWEGGQNKRTYIQAAGFDRGYAGCRSHQLYWDHNKMELVSRIGKGICPSKYNEAVRCIVEAFDVE